MAEVEKATGLDFFTELGKEAEERLEKVAAKEMWQWVGGMCYPHTIVPKAEPLRDAGAPIVELEHAAPEGRVSIVTGKMPALERAIVFNCYQADPRSVIRQYSAFGKPLIIGESSVRGEDGGLPNTKGAGPKVKTRAERAAAFEQPVMVNCD
jgi:hypothetical protein